MGFLKNILIYIYLFTYSYSYYYYYLFIFIFITTIIYFIIYFFSFVRKGGLVVSDGMLFFLLGACVKLRRKEGCQGNLGNLIGSPLVWWLDKI
jgi:hypothetical protein